MVLFLNPILDKSRISPNFEYLVQMESPMRIYKEDKNFEVRG